MNGYRRFEFWQEKPEDAARLLFYGQFFGKGSRVFDVGANNGNRSKIFHKLGANVIAFEPQSRCADYLEHVFRNKKDFHLERMALGAEKGTAEIHISNADTLSSMSQEWITSMKENGRFSDYQWNAVETIQVDTLDSLIEKYGAPDFIKIDVEGFEEQVLAGLSKPVKALSFEFVPEVMESIKRCIAKLESMGSWEYRISLGETMEFSDHGWSSAEEIIDVIGAVPENDFGDVYARYRTYNTK